MTTKTLLAGLAQMIADAGIGAFDPVGVYSDATGDSPPPVLMGPSIPSTPSEVIVLSAYTPAPDDPLTADSTVAVQMRIRGTEDVSTVQDVNDALFNLFQGLHDATVGGVPVVLMWRQSSLPMPTDDNDRAEMSANYYIRVGWPTTYRTD